MSVKYVQSLLVCAAIVAGSSGSSSSDPRSPDEAARTDATASQSFPGRISTPNILGVLSRLGGARVVPSTNNVDFHSNQRRTTWPTRSTPPQLLLRSNRPSNNSAGWLSSLEGLQSENLEDSGTSPTNQNQTNSTRRTVDVDVLLEIINLIRNLGIGRRSSVDRRNDLSYYPRERRYPEDRKYPEDRRGYPDEDRWYRGYRRCCRCDDEDDLESRGPEGRPIPDDLIRELLGYH